MFALMVLQTTLPAQTSRAASLITVPTDFPTIQSAIDAASPGDTIKVLPGTYTEQLTISKSLTIIGSGQTVTIVKAPDVLEPGILGIPNIIEISDSATVTMKGFTIKGVEGDSCGTSPLDGLTAVSVQEDATIHLDSSAIDGCNFVAVRVGFPFFLPGGPQVGHATITRTEVDNYRFTGIAAFTEGSTLTVSRSSVVAAEAPEIAGQVGIVFEFGAKGIITYNKVSENLCNNPACGPDLLNEIQSFGIIALGADEGSVISYNDVSSNDGGIAVAGNSGCCKIDHNVLTNNRFVGVVVQDGEHTISNTKISGGNVGVAAIAFSVDTVATLDRVIIVGTITPTQELSVGATAEVVSAPRSVLTTQSATLASIPISMPLPLPT